MIKYGLASFQNSNFESNESFILLVRTEQSRIFPHFPYGQTNRMCTDINILLSEMACLCANVEVAQFTEDEIDEFKDAFSLFVLFGDEDDEEPAIHLAQLDVLLRALRLQLPDKEVAEIASEADPDDMRLVTFPDFLAALSRRASRIQDLRLEAEFRAFEHIQYHRQPLHRRFQGPLDDVMYNNMALDDDMIDAIIKDVINN